MCPVAEAAASIVWSPFHASLRQRSGLGSGLGSGSGLGLGLDRVRVRVRVRDQSPRCYLRSAGSRSAPEDQMPTGVVKLSRGE